MYVEDSKIDKELYLQGDILLNFPFPHIQKQGNIYFIKEKSENVIILSQSCDLQFERESNERFVLCPLQTEFQIKQGLLGKGFPEAEVESRLATMRLNRKLDILFLPANDKIENSFAIFPKIISLDINSLEGKAPDIRLSERARHFLADKLHIYFCRAYDPLR